MKKYWVQTLLRQCRCHGIPFFFKQWGGVNKKVAGNLLDGIKWLEMPNAGASYGKGNLLTNAEALQSSLSKFHGQHNKDWNPCNECAYW
jgi:hypothetical protein